MLTPGAPDLLRRRAGLLRAAGVELWLEVTDVQEARLAADLGVDAVIAKGHEAGGRVGETTTFVLLQQLLAETKDAVRALLHATSGMALCPADVEIVEEPDGRLVAEGPWTQESPAVSLATRDGATVAVAGEAARARSSVHS